MAGAYRSADATVAARKAVAVVPNNATLIPVTRSLYVGTSGNLTVRMAEDQTNVTFANVQPGVFPVQVDMVFATGTTAADIVALY